jgi:hypothetical protein
MGVDLNVIIGHNLTSKEIMDFPSVLNRNKELKDVFLEGINSKLEHGATVERILSILEKEYFWQNITENDLLDSWKNNETPELVAEYGYICHMLDTYFGFLYFNKRTIDITYLPEHKYANLKYQANREFIFNFSKALAKLVGSEKIIYCADTGSTEIIECWATEGMTIESVLDLAIKEFGMPSTVVEEAIDKRFIIEDVQNPIY